MYFKGVKTSTSILKYFCFDEDLTHSNASLSSSSTIVLMQHCIDPFNYRGSEYMKLFKNFDKQDTCSWINLLTVQKFYFPNPSIRTSDSLDLHVGSDSDCR